MKKIFMTFAISVLLFAHAKEVCLEDQVGAVQKKQEHPFYTQANNLGKKATENLYEGHRLEELKLDTCLKEDLSSATPFVNNAVTIQVKEHGSDAKVFDKTDINKKDEKGRTLLHWAAYIGIWELLTALIEQGADVNAQDDLGWTPLHCAAYADHADVVTYLLAKGADRTIKTKRDASVYWVASVGGGHHLVLRALDGFEATQLKSPLFQAVVSK